MTYDEYQKAYFVDPPPEARFEASFTGAVLYYSDFGAAVEFYSSVLGPPNYSEGSGTRGWFLGGTSLTLLAAPADAPQPTAEAPRNTELCIQAATPAEVDRLHAALLSAGATGEAPFDTLMYRPVRYASIRDPFGTVIMLSAPR